MHAMSQEPNAYQHVRVSHHGAVTCVTLNRPHKRNALSLQVIAELRHAFDHLPAETGAVVLDGAGEHFCAGLDLSELAETSPAAVSYTHLTLPTNCAVCRSRWSPYH